MVLKLIRELGNKMLRKLSRPNEERMTKLKYFVKRIVDLYRFTHRWCSSEMM
jgi:hypothetical protein